jgi:hypothetical protein
VNTFGLLSFNKFYTNSNALSQFEPNMFGIESQILINVCGLAYCSVAKNYLKVLIFYFYLKSIPHKFINIMLYSFLSKYTLNLINRTTSIIYEKRL